MRLTALALASCFLLPFGAAKAEDLDCVIRPPWCQTGYTCAPTWCDVELRSQLEESKIEVRDLQRKSRRLHVDLTCGLGIATVVTQQWDLKAYPTPGACVIGLAFRVGK